MIGRLVQKWQTIEYFAANSHRFLLYRHLFSRSFHSDRRKQTETRRKCNKCGGGVKSSSALADFQY